MLGPDADSDVANEALVAFGNSVTKVSQISEKRCRANPTVDNFKDYIGKVRTNLLFGGEGFAAFPAGQKRLGPDKYYEVRPGDTRSGISQMFYGTEGL